MRLSDVWKTRVTRRGGTSSKSVPDIEPTIPESGKMEGSIPQQRKDLKALMSMIYKLRKAYPQFHREDGFETTWYEWLCDDRIPFAEKWRPVLPEDTPSTMPSPTRAVARFNLATRNNSDNNCILYLPYVDATYICDRPLLQLTGKKLPHPSVHHKTGCDVCKDDKSCSTARFVTNPEQKQIMRRRGQHRHGFTEPTFVHPSSAPKKDCDQIHEEQRSSTILARVLNLFSVFPGRWLDSVAIDMYLHVLQSHDPHRENLYVVSSQDDPKFSTILNTPGCMRRILLPLFKNAHWSLAFMSHDAKSIDYYNSQIGNGEDVDEQMAPFRYSFPNYKLNLLEVPQQCDSHSCGMYVCYFCYCLLFDRESLLSIRCQDARVLRQTILNQLLVSFCL